MGKLYISNRKWHFSLIISLRGRSRWRLLLDLNSSLKLKSSPKYNLELMHNDEKQCSCSSNVHRGSCSHAWIQFNWILVMLTYVLMWLGRRLAARAICLSFQIDHSSRTFIKSPTASTPVRNLEREYNYHTAFQACYIIIWTKCVHVVAFYPNGQNCTFRVTKSHFSRPGVRICLNEVIGNYYLLYLKLTKRKQLRWLHIV